MKFPWKIYKICEKQPKKAENYGGVKSITRRFIDKK